MVELVDDAPVQYNLIPVEYMREGMERYIEHGILPGSFLKALLSNDLMTCISRADEVNSKYINHWVKWLYNYAPFDCYGSHDVMMKWSKKKTAERLSEKVC